MNVKYWGLVLILIVPHLVWAQDQDFQAAADARLKKMIKTVNLTDDQFNAIRPVMKDYLAQKASLLAASSGGGIMDHESVKKDLKNLQKVEYEQLRKILSEDQMKKWIDKENLMAALNPDGGSNLVDEDTTLNPSGANFKF